MLIEYRIWIDTVSDFVTPKVTEGSYRRSIQPIQLFRSFITTFINFFFGGGGGGDGGDKSRLLTTFFL